MTDIKEPINTTSDGIFLSVVCENPPKSVVGQKLGRLWPPGITPLSTHKAMVNNQKQFSLYGHISIVKGMTVS